MFFTDFPNNYEIIVNPELPGTGKWSIPEVYIPAKFEPKALGGHLILKINAGKRWQIWHIEADANSQVWTTPNPDRLLIDGIEQALYVSVKDPDDIVGIKGYYLQVTAAEEQELLLLNDYTSITALDRSGIRWQTPSLCDDDMVIQAIDGDKILCTGFSLSDMGDKMKITLDSLTGAVLYDNRPTNKPRPHILHSIRNLLANITRSK